MERGKIITTNSSSCHGMAEVSHLYMGNQFRLASSALVENVDVTHKIEVAYK